MATQQSGRSGQLLVIGMLALGLTMAIIASRFTRYARPPIGTTAPSSQAGDDPFIP
ncbi:MAG TPA: hypothetical protein VHD56_07250 [Tepidisphaeraceae bacterium]|nr:hypothetical protein [Tepidisphaeraceae bacterium]